MLVGSQAYAIATRATYTVVVWGTSPMLLCFQRNLYLKGLPGALCPARESIASRTRLDSIQLQASRVYTTEAFWEHTTENQ